MKAEIGFALICVGLILCGSLSHAQITSTFNSDTDGWTLINDGDNDTLAVNHDPTGGLTGGRITGDVPSDIYPGFFWYAPAKFRGKLAYTSLGLTLTWSQQQLVTGNNAEFNGNYYEIYNADLVIRSGNSVIYYHTSPKPSLIPSWSTFSVTLDETSAWRTGEAVSSPLATREQIKRALLNVTEFRIRGNFNNTANTIALDDVSLGVRTINAAPAITTVGTLKGKAGESITINGSGFGSNIANNAVFFGGKEATITSATSNQLTVTIPPGAHYAPITVVNKTTGLVVESLDLFNPLFEGGGRIIPSTLDAKVDLVLQSTTGNDLTGQAIADLDGDGWNDIFFGESQVNSVAIHRNKGNGGDITAASFDSKILIPGGGNSSGVAARDVDGDGKLDILAGYGNGGTMYFVSFRNISTPGNIAFEPFELWAGAAYSGGFANVFDIDGDGLVDLIGQHGNGSVNVDLWISQNISTPGNIEFLTSVSYFGGSLLDAGSGVSVGDLDNDNKPDLIVKHAFDGQFSIIKNNSTPGNIALETPLEFGINVSGSLNVADLNLDGLKDLIWKDGNSNDDVHIRLNTHTTGPFLSSDFATEVLLNSNMLTYGSLSINDINGDGKPDILTTDSRHFGVFENVFSGGAFNANAFVPSYAHLGGGISTYMNTPLAVDLNGDEKPDIVVGITNTGPPRVSIYENKNTVAPVISLQTVSPLKGPVGSTVTISGDHFSTTPSENLVRFGNVSANVLTATKNQLTVEVPAGALYAPVSVTRDQLTAIYDLPFNLTFSPGTTFDNTSFAPPATFTLTTADYDIDVADLDGDGMLDVVAEGLTVDGFAFRNVYTTGPITSSSLVADDTTNSSAGNLRLVDVNDDNKPDIVTNSGIYQNTSTSGNINFANLISSASGSNNVSWNDFNKDGKIDIAGTEASANIMVFESWMRPGPFVQTGDYGSFGASVDVTKPAGGGGTASADFDRDGLFDIVATNPTTDNITVFRNTGGFRVAATQFTTTNFASLDNPGRVYPGDLDVDGKTDLLIYHGTGVNANTISVFHNQSTAGSIAFTRVDYVLPTNSTVAWISDLDGDGKPEILVTSEAGDRFFILKNTSSPGTLNASSFAAPFTTTVNNPRGIATGDINLDGRPEIIVASAPNSLLVYENLVPTGPTITINTQPTFTYACEGSTATFSVVATGTTNITYRWQKFDGTVFTDLNDGGGYSGTATSTLSINTATTGFNGNGEYRCRINGDLAPEVFSDDAQLTINGLPSPPDVTGDTGCVSPTTLTLTATGGSDGDYKWYDVATGGSVLGVNGSFTTPSLTSTKTFYVTISDTFCESTRAAVDATISLLAKPTLNSSEPIVSGGINICDGETITLTAPTGFTTYTWSNGEATQQIVVDQPGLYSVIVEDAGGCISPSSDAVNVTVNPYPTATITANGSLLTASTGDSYQWHENGAAVSGATSQTFEYSVLEYGEYAVDVTDNGCTSTSNTFTYLITGTESFSDGFKLYPNPLERNLYVEYHPPFEVNITTPTGSIVRSITSNKQFVFVDFSDLAQGLYIVQLKNENGISYHRITKK